MKLQFEKKNEKKRQSKSKSKRGEDVVDKRKKRMSIVTVINLAY